MLKQPCIKHMGLFNHQLEEVPRTGRVGEIFEQQKIGPFRGPPYLFRYHGFAINPKDCQVMSKPLVSTQFFRVVSSDDMANPAFVGAFPRRALVAGGIVLAKCGRAEFLGDVGHVGHVGCGGFGSPPTILIQIMSQLGINHMDEFIHKWFWI